MCKCLQLILAVAAISLPLSACSDGTASGSAATTTAKPDTWLLNIAENRPAAQQKVTLAQKAIQNLAQAKGTMFTYANMVASHGTESIKQRFASVKKTFDACVDTASSLSTQLAASSGKDLPALVERFNANEKRLEQALSEGQELEMAALTSR